MLHASLMPSRRTEKLAIHHAATSPEISNLLAHAFFTSQLPPSLPTALTLGAACRTLLKGPEPKRMPLLGTLFGPLQDFGVPGHDPPGALGKLQPSSFGFLGSDSAKKKQLPVGFYQDCKENRILPLFVDPQRAAAKRSSLGLCSAILPPSGPGPTHACSDANRIAPAAGGAMNGTTSLGSSCPALPYQ